MARHDPDRIIALAPMLVMRRRVPPCGRPRAGDGDPFDISAIGPASERGTVIPVKVVGVIRCLDGAEQDDKVVRPPAAGVTQCVIAYKTTLTPIA